MSGYTIGEIVGWLLLTAVLAFALGWLSRELVLRTRAPVGKPAQGSATPAPTSEPEEREPEVAGDPDPDPDPVTPGPHPGSALPRDDGSAPSEEYVIKVSRSSKIFHGPASPAYARTTAAIWFVDAESAEAAGFRRPKNA